MDGLEPAIVFFVSLLNVITQSETQILVLAPEPDILGTQHLDILHRNLGDAIGAPVQFLLFRGQRVEAKNLLRFRRFAFGCASSADTGSTSGTGSCTNTGTVARSATTAPAQEVLGNRRRLKNLTRLLQPLGTLRDRRNLRDTCSAAQPEDPRIGSLQPAPAQSMVSPPSDAQARPQAARLVVASSAAISEVAREISCSKDERDAGCIAAVTNRESTSSAAESDAGGRLGANHRRQRVARTAARTRRNQVIDRLMQFFGRALDSFQVVTQRSRYRLLDCVWICRHTLSASSGVGPKLQIIGTCGKYCQLRIGHRFRPAHVAGRQLTVDS